jgi:hypothetical protein
MDNGKDLQIINKKPIDNPEYVLEADASEVKNMRQQRNAEFEESKKNIDLFEETNYRFSKSSASCCLEDV